MVWFGAIAELTSVVATTFISLIGTARIMASRAAQPTAASDASDPSTPTTILDRKARQYIASSRQKYLWLHHGPRADRGHRGREQHHHADGVAANTRVSRDYPTLCRNVALHPNGKPARRFRPPVSR